MSNTVICHYRVIPGQEQAFEQLLAIHWPKLLQLGLVTPAPATRFVGKEQDNDRPIYFEIFTWAAHGVDQAHSHPEVQAIWGPMDALCEARGDKPNMEFPHVEQLHLATSD